MALPRYEPLERPAAPMSKGKVMLGGVALVTAGVLAAAGLSGHTPTSVSAPASSRASTF